MDTYWIAVAAAIISLATLIYGVRSGRHKAESDYVEGLERRLEAAEVALKRCREAEASLQTEKANLMGEAKRNRGASGKTQSATKSRETGKSKDRETGYSWIGDKSGYCSMSYVFSYKRN